MPVDPPALRTGRRATAPLPAADGPAAAGPEGRRQAARSGGVLLAPLLRSRKPGMAAPTPSRRAAALIFAALHAASARISVCSDGPATGAMTELPAARLALFQPDIAANTATIL